MNPVGSLPPRVYWLRRAVVTLVMIAALVLVVVVINKIGSSEKQAAPGAGSTTSASPGDVPTCVKADLAVTLAANGTSFAAGKNPVFTVDVTNTAEGPCLADITEVTRPVSITSGKDNIWSSAHCGDAKSRVLLIGAGKKESSTLTWDRTRSEKNCPASPKTVKPGTYRAKAQLLGVNSDEVVFTLK